ncbi:MAG: hypothetical protein E7360_04075 [Clostridiales bacterium]|nr:hypothetical protein [Clostridiales bacterium]
MVYEIADLRIKINNKFSFTDRFCKDYLSNDQDSAVDIEVEVSEDEFKKERDSVQNFSDGYIENLAIYRKICEQMPERNRFLMHTAVLEYKGNAYAFLGKSGTGKSTHTGLWLKNLEGAKILNGDKPIIGYHDGVFTVYGTPWMGKERFGYNGKAPLKSLCFLEQAKVNEISLIPVEDVAQRLFIQLLMPVDFIGVAKTLELADSLVKSVPSYLLKCDISDEAFRTSFNKIVKGE